MVYNTLFIFLNTQRDGLCLKKKDTVHTFEHEKTLHTSFISKQQKRKDSACLIMLQGY